MRTLTCVIKQEHFFTWNTRVQINVEDWYNTLNINWKCFKLPATQTIKYMLQYIHVLASGIVQYVHMLYIHSLIIHTLYCTCKTHVRTTKSTYRTLPVKSWNGSDKLWIFTFELSTNSCNGTEPVAIQQQMVKLTRSWSVLSIRKNL